MTVLWEQRVGAALVSHHRAPLEARTACWRADRADPYGAMDPACRDRRPSCGDGRGHARNGFDCGDTPAPAERVVIKQSADCPARNSRRSWLTTCSR